CKLPKHIYNTLCQIEYTLEEKHEEFTVLMRASNKIKVPIYKYDFVFPQGDCEIGQCSLYGELDDLVYEDYVDYKKVLLSNLPKHIYNSLCQIEYTLDEKDDAFNIHMRASKIIE